MIVIVEESKNGIFLTAEESQAEWVIVVGASRNYTVFHNGNEVGSALTLDFAYDLISKNRAQLIKRDGGIEVFDPAKLTKWAEWGSNIDGFEQAVDCAAEEIRKALDAELVRQLIAESSDSNKEVHDEFYEYLLAISGGQSTANVELAKKEEPQMITACAGRKCATFENHFGIPVVHIDLRSKI